MKNKSKHILILAVMMFGSIFIVPNVIAPAAQTASTATYHIELWYDNSGHYGDTEDDVALMLQTQLENTGFFDVTLKSTDWTTYKSQRTAGTMPMYLMGWWPDYQDESDYIQPFVGDTAFFAGSLHNTTMDGYVTTMSESSDAGVRATAQKNAQSLLVQQAPLIPLFTMTNQFVVYTPDMSGVVLEPSENLHYASLKKGTTPASVTLGTTDSIPALDPANGYEFFVSNTLFQTSHGLVQLPVTGTQAENVVANNIAISADGLTYTFNITSGLHFTDGSPLTVEDIVWSLQRATSLNGEPQGLVDSIDNNTIAKVNSTALTFNLKHKDGILLQKMTYSNSYIWKMNSTITNTIQGQSYIPIGLGPYKITHFVPTESIVFTPVDTGNEAILGTQAPQNTAVTVKFYTQSSAMKTAIEGGDLDVSFHTFSTDEIASLSSNANLKTATKDTAGIRYILFNVDTVSNRLIRQAVSYSIDRSEFVTTIFSGQNAELYSIVSPAFANACKEGDSCAFPGKDLAKVSDLMTGQGYTGSTSSTTSTPGLEMVALVVSFTVVSAIYLKKRRNT